MELQLAFIIALALALLHLLGEELESWIGGYRESIVSFGSGVSISYIFLHLVPEIQRISASLSSFYLAFPLAGFSSIHLIEKYVSKSRISPDKMKKDFAEIHSTFLFLYNGAIGYLVASLLSKNFVSGVLFLIPLALHIVVSSMSVTELHEKFASKKIFKVSISIAPLVGVLFYQQPWMTERLFDPVFGVVVGMFMYVVIRDSIPSDDKGKPVEYLAGTLLYLILILALNGF